MLQCLFKYFNQRSAYNFNVNLFMWDFVLQNKLSWQFYSKPTVELSLKYFTAVF